MGVISKFKAIKIAHEVRREGRLVQAKSLALIAGFVLLGVSPGAADAIYTYTGNVFINYYPSSSNPFAGDSITGSFTVTEPLADNLALSTITPESFSFSAGPVTITNSTAISGGIVFEVATNAAGVPDEWEIDLSSTNGFEGESLETINCCAGKEDQAATAELGTTAYQADGDPGTWSLESNLSATPLPATLPLLVTGLGAFGLLGRRRKRKAHCPSLPRRQVSRRSLRGSAD